ncbi:heme ABC exporter ATP-binding protein CcmA [Adhaeribacter aerolatus]|uniref:Heme ABC exporter ATP-binding protein CcmA n=1 Tax=Adhaeribacter aerolatus TaxID=670289 RepID=A0A512B3I3_9BACT|nr:ABC transporter ATP-binding protein [Adhaeribacter aerolatus]GEO06520.1 heme ABC exporter ATP-binding protein CcmA [Adhaeribacter aerolatus]
MQINLSGLGKRYNYEWIFRRLDYNFLPETAYAILGHNGSGKSTLLNLLSGYLSPSEGSITHTLGHQTLTPDNLYRHLSFTAPYLELVEEYTLLELVQFHSHFRAMRTASATDLIDRLYLKPAKDKFVKDFSSGMKQRLKLGLAIYTDAPLLLLDEPTTNLDQEGINWYLEHVSQNRKDRLVIVSSNVAHEYSFCDEIINITDYHYKPKAAKKI